jgi:methionine synthase II (cobalamin-independent)
LSQFWLYDGRVAFRVLAFHYPRSEHRDEMVARIKRAAEVMAACRGFVAADCWLEEDGEAVVAIGTFDSKEQWQQAMRAVAAADIDFDFDERERAPRRVQLLRKT